MPELEQECDCETGRQIKSSGGYVGDVNVCKWSSSRRFEREYVSAYFRTRDIVRYNAATESRITPARLIQRSFCGVAVALLPTKKT